MIKGDEDSLNIEMVEGDYGIVLPIKLENRTLSSDEIYKVYNYIEKK